MEAGMGTRALLGVSLLVAIASILTNAAYAYPHNDPHGYFMTGGWGGMGPFMMLIPLAVMALFVWFIINVLTVRNPHFENDQALSILRERFAKGEIDLKEFEVRKRKLSKSNQ